MDISRLEARELLAHLNIDTCDPDVVDKLIQCAQSTTRTQALPRPLIEHTTENAVYFDLQGSVPLVDINEVRKLVSDDDDLSDVSIPTAAVLTEKLIERGWKQEDIDKVNLERRIGFDAYMAGRQGIPIGKHPTMQPVTPDGYGTQRVAVGQKNAVGDECVKHDHNGDSVFQCKEGHGYVGNNPAFKGCPQCFVTEGKVATAVSAESEDRGAIEGVDSRW